MEKLIEKDEITIADLIELLENIPPDTILVGLEYGVSSHSGDFITLRSNIETLYYDKNYNGKTALVFE